MFSFPDMTGIAPNYFRVTPDLPPRKPDAETSAAGSLRSAVADGAGFSPPKSIDVRLILPK
jgi:hypothetical protein